MNNNIYVRKNPLSGTLIEKLSREKVLAMETKLNCTSNKKGNNND